jgi:small multidrug resistance family-3 protein
VTANLIAFVFAAFFEIAGCFAFWTWLRQGRSPAVAVLGILSLVAFAVILTCVDTAFAGRAYAAYGGVYIAASLAWLWAIEGQRPTATDLLGAGLAVAGALIIIGAAVKRLS